MRFQDPSSSLGGSYKLNKMKDILSIMKFGRVNAFSSSFIKGDSEKIKIAWNDLGQYKRYFENTTYNDLKWAARKIANLKKNDIYKVLKESGMPKLVCDLYYIKLITRRNEMVKVFSFQDIYGLIEVPDLKNYNIKDDGGKYL